MLKEEQASNGYQEHLRMLTPKMVLLPFASSHEGAHVSPSSALIALLNTMLILASAGRRGGGVWLPGELCSQTHEGNRQRGQGSPNRGNRLQVSDIFLSLP